MFAAIFGLEVVRYSNDHMAKKKETINSMTMLRSLIELDRL